MDAQLSSQADIAQKIKQLRTNYKKDGADRKTRTYLEAKIAVLKSLYTDYQQQDGQIIQVLDKSHEYYQERHVVADVYNSFINDMRQRLINAPSTPTTSTANLSHIPDINFVPPRDDKGEQLLDNTSYNPSTKFSQLIKHQNIKMRHLYREINSAKKLIEEQKPSQALKVAIKHMEKMMDQIMDLHETICVEATEQDEEESNYFREEYYDNIKGEYDNAITLFNMELDNKLNKTVQQKEIRLPTIEIPKFEGDYVKWTAFADTFNKLVNENNSLTATHKINYLKQHVGGSAAKLINHLESIGDNHQTAWDILNNRYQNRRLVVSNYLSTLWQLPTINMESAASIRNLHDTTVECLHGLKNAGVNIESWSPIIIFMISKKFDSETRRLYECSLKNPKELQETEEFLKFIEGRFQSLEACANNKAQITQQTKRSFVTTSNICVFCQKNHTIKDCQGFQQMSVAERNQIVMLHKLCRKCLLTNHQTHNCKSNTKCAHCNGHHNNLLHEKPKHKNETKNTTSCISQKDDGVLLATALIKVENRLGGFEMLRALIDPGSQATFITEEAAQLLNIPKKRALTRISGISTSEGVSHQKIAIQIKPRFPSTFRIQADALILKNITKPLPDKDIVELDNIIHSHIILADPTFSTSGPIDLLIGADLYAEILQQGLKKNFQGKCIAQKTRLGWIISGRMHTKPDIPAKELNSLITLADIDEQLKQFWETEELHHKRVLTPAEIECEQHYKDTHKRLENGHYEVSIPFNQQIKSDIGESKNRAAARLLQIEKRLEKDVELKREYYEFMNEYIRLNHMELIEDDNGCQQTYYLPHHPVIKETSTTTKVRVVFDASCKTTLGISLNEMMHVGPTLQDNLTSILIRWKKHKYVITADIEKMFRQIKMKDEHQDFQRILWRTDTRKPMRSYRLKTVTYGTAAATYLATRTLKQLAMDDATKYPIGSKIMLKDFYVDDLLSGTDTIETTIAARNELLKLMWSGGFQLRKWASNNNKILEDLPENLKETGLHSIDFDDTIRTLGLVWNPSTDTFQFKVKLIDDKKPITKRTILSEASKLFDPLGCLAPVIIQAKILLQDLWASGVGWDDKVNTSIEKRWSTYVQELHELEHIRIDRWINYKVNKRIELHGFCDASNHAYSAVVYSKINNVIAIIAAKTKVAPLNQTISLPRLELNGDLLLSKLLRSVIEAIDINQPITTFCWTDSMAVLGWIKGKPQQHKTFVANRITEIQSNTNPSQWHHISSSQNPADCASRGMNPGQLLTYTLWWEGPSWLKGIIYPTTNIDSKELELAGSMEHKPLKSLAILTNQPVIDFERFSSMTRLTRSIAYCLRLASNIKLKAKNISPLTPKEVDNALKTILRIVQLETFGIDLDKLKTKQRLSNQSIILTLNPFIDSEGLLRVGGRLQNSHLTFDEKHPIILPRNHYVSKLIIREAHYKTLHGGHQATLAYIRNKYWPLNVKSTIRHIIHNCLACTRAKKITSQQLMGILPPERVIPSSPFTNTGVDYAGPINLKLYKGRCNKTSKGYIAIFICMATKAMHLELVSDLTTEAFLASFKRFTSRRGICKKVFSDCGTNFVGASKQLKKQAEQYLKAVADKIGETGTEWHFIPPGSPHFGGLWEAGVKSIKQHLRKVIGMHTLTFEELSTLLTQIEACLNSRPLAPISNDIDDDTALTPGHFLIGRSIIATPESDMTNINHVTRWNLLTKMKQQLWKQWSNEYLSRLQKRPKWLNTEHDIRKGELVVIKDEQLPPTHWPLARVIEVHPGIDGLVRVVTVKYKNNLFKKNITKICRLPIISEINENEKSIVTPGPSCTNITSSSNVSVNLTTTMTAPKFSEKRKHEDSDHRNAEHKQKRATKDWMRGAVDPEVIETAKQLRRTKSQKSSLKIHPWMKAALYTTTILCLMVMPTINTLQVNPFNYSAGIYFEELGKIEVVAMKWNLVVYYNMTGYWKEVENFKQTQEQLSIGCIDVIELNCDLILQQLQWQYENLMADNELLLPSNNKARRLKRGLGDTIGVLLGDMFGILTEREAKEYEVQFEKINGNEQHLVELMKNQTTILDNTIKLVKHNTNLTMASLNNFIKDHQTLRQEIALLNEYHLHEEKERLILTTTIELMLILKNLEDTQKALLDVLYNAHNNILHPSILTPAQLEQELKLIKQNVPTSITIPGHDIPDVIHIYRCMQVRNRVTLNNIIIKITIPLSFTTDYTLMSVIPVPNINHNDTQTYISTDLKYLAVDNHREHFASLATEDISRCQMLQTQHFLCEISTIHTTIDYKGQCEIAILKRRPDLESICTTGTIKARNHWIKLYAANQWIYVVPNETTVNVICGPEVNSYSFHGSGTVRVNAGCTLRDSSSYIIAVDSGQNTISKAFNNSINSMNSFSSLKEFGSRIRNKTIHHNNLQTMAMQDTLDLEEEIQNIKQNEFLPYSKDVHHIHHYTMIHVIFWTGVLLLIFWGIKYLRRRIQINHPAVSGLPPP